MAAGASSESVGAPDQVGSHAGIRVGIDTGGTFTDVVAVDESTGRTVTTKTPSTPSDPAVGFMNAVHKVIDMFDRGGGGDRATDPRRDLAAISHGTTVATNQLLEDQTHGLGFVTTEGYEFVLEIARQSVPDGYGNSYFWVKPARIVPAHLVRTVPGRLDYRGAEIRPFDRQRAAEVARWFRDAGIDTIGVCFLHAYANPDHERAMREVLAREHPEATVSISSEVLREYREYERSVTTLVDAAVKPRLSRYIRDLIRRLEVEVGSAKAGTGPPLHLMKSNGGVISAGEVAHQPISTVLSGPAAGALGAAYLAAYAGTDRVITLDGGGTSTDVALVLDGEPALTTEGSVGRFPARIPMVDVVTVGAGGGSIAWVSPEGTLKVGPRSAGADPGPLCYKQGGTEPTVTDAHLALGRIPPHLLAGEVPLDAAAAWHGIAALAGDLGIDPEAAAVGILDISAWNQANAIRQVTVQRGLDVRDFMLATFGGSGSLLACRLVDVLGLRGVVVPPDPGTVSAYGLLTVDVKDDYVQTHVVRGDDLNVGTLAEVYADLERRAAAALDAEGFARADQRNVRMADLRYSGQGGEVRVTAPGGAITGEFVSAVQRAFHDEHERLYGYCYRDRDSGSGRGTERRDDERDGVAGRVGEGGRGASEESSATKGTVEWVNLRVSGVGPISRPQPHTLPVRGGGPARARTGSRQVHFDTRRDTAVYWRPDLAPGDELAGPAIVEEFGSTVPVHPGFAARVDVYGNLILTRTEAVR